MDDVFVRKYLKHLRNYLRTIGFDSMRVRTYLQKFKDGLRDAVGRSSGMYGSDGFARLQRLECHIPLLMHYYSKGIYGGFTEWWTELAEHIIPLLPISITAFTDVIPFETIEQFDHIC